jgi:hypothetical protein
MEKAMPMPNRFTRALTLAAMSGSLVLIVGGALVSTAGPSSAATGGTNVCSSWVGTVDESTAFATSTFSGCHEHGSATSEGHLGDPTYPIYWATGHATSVVTVRIAIVPGPCPAGELNEANIIKVIGGPYAGSTGHALLCLDLSKWPIVHVKNFGPVVI